MATMVKMTVFDRVPDPPKPAEEKPKQAEPAKDSKPVEVKATPAK